MGGGFSSKLGVIKRQEPDLCTGTGKRLDKTRSLWEGEVNGGFVFNKHGALRIGAVCHPAALLEHSSNKAVV